MSYHVVDFAVLAVKRVQYKIEKKEKYLDLAIKLKTLRKMMVTLISIVAGAIQMVPNGLKNTEGIGNHIKNQYHC